jgi:NAD(P)H-hydrate epimerase
MTSRRGRRSTRDVWGSHHVPLVTPEEAATLDAAARERYDVPERVLMESAGRAAALVLDRLFPRGRVAVAAGSGNNGGDALVLARVLSGWGRDVTVVSAGSKPPDPALRHGFDIRVSDSDDDPTIFSAADVLVDGILGTGSRGAPREPAATAIEAMNASGRPILALDLPSGVHAATGDVEGLAVRATATVAFGWPKIGLLFHPARTRCGRLIAVEIGFPPFHATGLDAALLITPGWAAERLPNRPPSAHKGTSGRLLMLAGTDGMAGAAVIAARAAQRSGAGLIHVASTAANRVIIQTAVHEAIYADRSALAEWDSADAHALLAGPGIGTDDPAARALDAALEVTPGVRTALDADALNLFARTPDRLGDIAQDRDLVITPHPGELGRLLDESIAAIVDDPAAAAREAAARFGCSVLLKGQPSIIASPGQPLLVSTVGSSDVATAGMGDQLSGVIGAMLAAGLSAREAAAVALFYSGRAADLAGHGRSLGPSDVSDRLGDAFTDPGARRSPTGLPFVTFDQPARW